MERLIDNEVALVSPKIADAAATTPTTVEELFTAHSRRLVGALTIFTGDPGDAEDLAQEAFARVYANRSRLRDDDRAVSYLYSVAFNLARSRWRRQGSLGRVFERLGRSDEVAADPAGISTERNASAATMAAVSVLPDRQRACVLLHYYSDLSVAETADALKISTNSVKTHLRRALTAMRSSLAEEDRS